MDAEATGSLLTSLGEIADVDVVETESEEGAWLLNVGGAPVAIELEQGGAILRLIAELGLEPDRASEVLSSTELCLGMLRFNGDQHEDAVWIGLRTEDPCFVLTRQLLTADLTDADLAARLKEFTELYDAWFEVTETMAAEGPGPADDAPQPPPSKGWIKI